MAFEVAAGQGQGHDAPPAPASEGVPAAMRPVLSSVDSTAPPPHSPDDGPKGKPRLTIVKS
jgi:hypothetical protein